MRTISLVARKLVCRAMAVNVVSVPRPVARRPTRSPGLSASVLAVRRRTAGLDHTRIRSATITDQPPRFERRGIFTFDNGLELALQLLSLPDPPTAIVCGDDLQAMGVYEAARQTGLRVPDDLSLVGFDDVDQATWTSPPPTTVRQSRSRRSS